MGRLEDRIVEFDISGIRGYVRQYWANEFRWFLKNFNTPADEPVEILGSGKSTTSTGAFADLYRCAHEYELRVSNEK